MTVKLEGIFEQVLGGYLCIRGYAPLGVLAQCSQADPGYQRDLINTHRSEIFTFLSDSEFLFFPEVILSCSLTYDYEKKGSISGLKPLRKIQERENFKSNKDGLSIRFRKTGNKEIREKMPRVTLSFNAEHLKLSRIDGNHRLSACEEDMGSSPSTFDHTMMTPFCILIFEDVAHSKAIFHNINYKHIRLTMEESLKLILEDTALFDDEKLKRKFGEEYLTARHIWQKAEANDFIGILHFAKEATEPRTAAYELGKFLKDCSGNTPEIGVISQAIIEAGNGYKQKFHDHPCGLGLMVTAVYYALDSRPKLDQFLGWAWRNHIHRIEDTPEKRGITPESLKRVYECVLGARNKTIFVSMPFADDSCDSQYNAIEDVVQEINRAHHADLKIYRVDRQPEGNSFQITDKILEEIKGAGMLIANLSHHRPNVYHEVGFAMGLAEAMEQPSKVLLIVHDNFAENVAFNLNSFNQVRFSTDKILKDKIRPEIEAHYNLR